jgi:macrodomain Ter protein organizer (MatP/YcbG family)
LLDANFGLALGFLGVVALAAACGLALATLRLRTPSQAEKLREQIDRAAAEERLDELSQTIERRRKRAEAAEQRRKERDARDVAAPVQQELPSADERRRNVLNIARSRGQA